MILSTCPPPTVGLVVPESYMSVGSPGTEKWGWRHLNSGDLMCYWFATPFEYLLVPIFPPRVSRSSHDPFFSKVYVGWGRPQLLSFVVFRCAGIGPDTLPRLPC